MVLRVVGVPLAGASPLLEAIEGALGGEDRGGGQEGRLELEHLVLHQRQLHQVVRQAPQLPLKKKNLNRPHNRFIYEILRSQKEKGRTVQLLGVPKLCTFLSDSAALRNLCMKT